MNQQFTVKIRTEWQLKTIKNVFMIGRQMRELNAPNVELVAEAFERTGQDDNATALMMGYNGEPMPEWFNQI